MSPIRYYDRRRAPLIKRLAAATLLVLFLGLLASDHRAARDNQALLQQMRASQDRRIDRLVVILEELRSKIASEPQAGGVTAADIDRIIAEVRALHLGGGRPAPAVSTTVTSGPTTTTTSTRPSTTTTGSSTTTTTRCLLAINGRCIP